MRPLGPEDDQAARVLHGAVPAPDLAAASPLPSDALLAVGMLDGADLVGIAALVATPAGPPEISVLVGPGARGRGAASALEGEVLRRAAGRWEWVQHRTVESDLPSRRLAARCGFRLVSVEHLVRPAPSDD
ncbi:GNAT family N-acetyltransferase [Klenkia sp. LSe6-5]|uniref:GNAT family N-acetyltransferase n=1 Tax=Klenkia sesuvii TaxID=3103137 RepID=A0ABU8DTU5_9ACTN